MENIDITIISIIIAIHIIILIKFLSIFWICDKKIKNYKAKNYKNTIESFPIVKKLF
jgi:hypothetical protein